MGHPAGPAPERGRQSAAPRVSAAPVRGLGRGSRPRIPRLRPTPQDGVGHHRGLYSVAPYGGWAVGLKRTPHTEVDLGGTCEAPFRQTLSPA